MIDKTFVERTQRVRLPNGVTLLVYENPANPTVHVSGALRAGSFLDPQNQPGLAQITASMLMRGTRRRTKVEIARDLEDVGAELNISGNRFLVRASGQALSKDAPRLLANLVEVLREPAFPEDELTRLKQQVVGQLRRQQEQTQVRALERFLQLTYDRTHPFYQVPIEERIASVEALTVDDVAAFYAQHYGAATLIVVVVGDIQSAAIEGIVTELLGDWTPGRPAEIAVGRTEPRREPRREIITMRDKPNVDIVLGHPGQLRRTDPDYYAAYIANAALGHSTLSSRLGLRVRDEEGLTYGIVSRFLDPGLVDGPWLVSLTVNPENVDRAIDSTVNIITSYVEEGITERELEDEKSSFVGSFIVSLGTNAGIAGHLLSVEVYGLGIEHLDVLPELVKSVTRDEVNAAIAKYIHPEQLLTVIAGEYPPE